MKFFLQRVSIWVNIPNKFQVPRSHSIWTKCDTICMLSSQFSQKLCDRGTWNLVSKEYPYGLIYKINFKFLGRTVLEKNAMLTCKILKLFIRTNCATLDFCKLSSHFSQKLCDRGTWNLVCIEYPYGLIYKINFKFLGCTVSEKNAILIASYHRIFVEKCVIEEHEIFFAIEYPYGLIYKINFKFLGCTVSEKNEILIASYHRIFLDNCVTEEYEIFFAKSIHIG